MASLTPILWISFSCYLKEEKIGKSKSLGEENLASGEDSENIKQNLNIKKIEPNILNLNIGTLKLNH